MVNAQTVKSIGARFCKRDRVSSRVRESLPPETPTATRSPGANHTEAPNGFANLPQNCSIDVHFSPRYMTGILNPRSIGSWCRRTWSEIRPGSEARRGAVWAALATVIWAVLVGALNLKLGYGGWVNFLFACAVAALGIPVVALAVALLLTIFRKLPRRVTGFLVGAFLFLSALFWFDSLGFWTAGAVLAIECTLGAAVATVFAR